MAAAAAPHDRQARGQRGDERWPVCRTLDCTRVALSRDFAAERRLVCRKGWFGDVCRSRDAKAKEPGSRFGTGVGVPTALSTASAVDEIQASPPAF
jgi:hypothetical protein